MDDCSIAMKSDAVSRNYVITAEKIQDCILEHLTSVPTEMIPIDQSLNRVPAEDIISETNLPGFSLSVMDGFAVRAADVSHASAPDGVFLRVVETVKAGDIPKKSVEPGTAIRIMTGAPLPEGADAVVPFEDTGEVIHLHNLPPDHIAILKPVSKDENVRLKGSDIRSGSTVLVKGKRIRPQDMGMLASIGKAEVLVHQIPRVGILQTGNEIVGVESPLGFGKIRNSNSYIISGLVRKYGAEPVILGIAKDSREDLLDKLKLGVSLKVDLLLTCAGTSNGDYDLINHVFRLFCRDGYWESEVKPGKFITFGKAGGTLLLALPGNPGAAMINFEMFARNAVLKLAGLSRWKKPMFGAVLKHDIHDKKRRHLVPAVLTRSEGSFVVEAPGFVENRGKGEKMSMLVRINSFVDVPFGVTFIPAGSEVHIWPLDELDMHIPEAG